MLQQERPDDFVISSGETHAVREFVELAFDAVGLDPFKVVEFDTHLMRPADGEHLLGDCSKAKKALGWNYKFTFEKVVREMVDADLVFYSRGGSGPEMESALEGAAVGDSLQLS